MPVYRIPAWFYVRADDAASAEKAQDEWWHGAEYASEDVESGFHLGSEQEVREKYEEITPGHPDWDDGWADDEDEEDEDDE